MNEKIPLVSRVDRFLKREAARRLKSFLSTPAADPLIGIYYRYCIPAMRFFYPLFGATVMVGVTYRCQCSCVHCGTTSGRDPGRTELSYDEILDAVRQAAELGAVGVYLLGGEPLLAPGLAGIIAEARGRGLKVMLDTNGLLLDAVMAGRLASAGLDSVGISLDSADETVHDGLRGCPGVYRSAVNAAGFCRDAGLDVYISTYATRENLRDGGLDRVIALGRSLGAAVRVLSPVRAGKWLKRGDVTFGPEEIALLRSRLSQDVYWESPLMTSPKRKFVCGCTARAYFYLTPYGDVQPCCYIPLAFGSVRAEPLRGIIRRMWGSPSFSRLDSSTDCPMNSPAFRSSFGAALARAGTNISVQDSSPNDRSEWDDWAPFYGAEVDWLEAIHNRDIRELAPPEGKRILDIGCGTGRRARAVFGGAASITAADSSRGMAAVAREVLKDLKQARVLELDIEKDALPEGLEFDTAVAVSVMHHINDAAGALERVKSRLAPGGVVIIIDALSGNPPAAAAKYYLEMLSLHNPLRLAKAFLKTIFLDTRMSRHKRREAHLTFEEFRSRYAAVFPGAHAEVRHGLFGYLVWKKPE